MSKEENILTHKNVIAKARQLPIGNRRMVLINRSIQGIIRALALNYNESHI